MKLHLAVSEDVAVLVLFRVEYEYFNLLDWKNLFWVCEVWSYLWKHSSGSLDYLLLIVI